MSAMVVPTANSHLEPRLTGKGREQPGGFHQVDDRYQHEPVTAHMAREGLLRSESGHQASRCRSIPKPRQSVNVVERSLERETKSLT